MLRDILKEAKEIIENHKFGAKRADIVKASKENAKRYMSLIKTLPEDYYKIMYLLWMAEYKAHEAKQNKDKEMEKKMKASAKQIYAYIQDEIDSVVYP